MNWESYNTNNLPPLYTPVLLRRKPTNYSGVKYFVAERIELRAPDQRPLGWAWHGGGQTITKHHLSHWAIIEEPLTESKGD